MSERHGRIYSEKRFHFFEDLYLTAIVYIDGTQYLAVEKKLPNGTFKTVDMLRCIHTVIYSGPLEELDRMMSERPMELVSTEGQEIELPLGDKAMAFSSWVQGIAEYGIDAIKLQMEMDSLASRQVPISRFLAKAVIKADPEYIIPLWDSTISPCFYEGVWVKSCVSANLKIISESMTAVPSGDRAKELYRFLAEKLYGLVEEDAVHTDVIISMLSRFKTVDDETRRILAEIYSMTSGKIIEPLIERLKSSNLGKVNFPEIYVIIKSSAPRELELTVAGFLIKPADELIYQIVESLDTIGDTEKKRLLLAFIIVNLKNIERENIVLRAVDVFIDHFRNDTEAAEELAGQVILTFANIPPRWDVNIINGNLFIKALNNYTGFIDDMNEILTEATRRLIAKHKISALEPMRFPEAFRISTIAVLFQYPVLKVILEHPELFKNVKPGEMLKTARRWMDILYSPLALTSYPDSPDIYIKVDEFLVRVIENRYDELGYVPAIFPTVFDKTIKWSGYSAQPEEVFLAYHVLNPSLRPPPVYVVSPYNIPDYIIMVEFCKPNVEDIIHFIGPEFLKKVEERFINIMKYSTFASDTDLAFIYAVTKLFPEIAENIPLDEIPLLPAIVMAIASDSDEYLQRFNKAEIKREIDNQINILTEGEGISEYIDSVIKEERIINDPTLLGFYTRFTDEYVVVEYLTSDHFARLEAQGTLDNVLHIVVFPPDDPSDIEVFDVTSPAVIMAPDYGRTLRYYLKMNIGSILYYKMYQLGENL